MKVKTTAIFLLTNTPQQILATHAFAEQSITRIVQYLKPSTEFTGLPRYTIFIKHEEDLHAFVKQIPELAWEMLEYAEEPLELVYPQKKYSPPFEDDNFISIRLVKQNKLNQLVHKFGPLITFPLEPSASYPDLPIDEEINCGDKKSPYHSVKTMKLFDDGSFTFLR
ncbi:hypothetical protein [Catalinimonas niigatensis]|uniref:hypothetical protein n=1 Tax=Catalinimonas niigatensis TaxID=1397264 RepID=UPI002665BACD|nr:hypothetical protein [Catalinimonas niigatensis]WPP51525.1 hypothetical protein PZB72_03875 [Catalinimonas niigatensis]